MEIFLSYIGLYITEPGQASKFVIESKAIIFKLSVE